MGANHGLHGYANKQQPCDAPSPLFSCRLCSCASLKGIEIAQVSPLSGPGAPLAHKKRASREFRGNRVHMYVLTPHARPACQPSKTRHPCDCRFDPTPSADMLRVLQPRLHRTDTFLSQKEHWDNTHSRLCGKLHSVSVWIYNSGVDLMTVTKHFYLTLSVS